MLRSSKRRYASFAITGSLLFACSLLTAGAAAQDLKDLSTKERLSRLEQLWENRGMADMILRLESMQQEMQRLQGDIEVQGHDIEVLQNSQREANQDFDRRLRELEQRISAGSLPPVQNPVLDQPALDPDIPASAILDGEAEAMEDIGTEIDNSTIPDIRDDQSPAPADSDPGAALETGPAETASSEQAAYQEAFGFLKKGQYDDAIAGFDDYLARYPKEDNADNAQYWLGEAHYVKRKFNDAQQAFETLLSRYPDTSKRADAMLKIGFIHYELGQWSQARQVLDEVKTNFPGTSAAQFADVRLQKMNNEGH